MRLFRVVAFVSLLGAGFFGAWPVGGAVPSAAYAQVLTVAVDDSTAVGIVKDAFRAGDVEALLDGAGDRVDIAIFGHGASYSRAQAALVLVDFFRKHPPDSVEFEEEVVAEDRRSVIGRYWEAGDAEPVAVFVRLHARGDGWQLRAIRIERDLRY